MYHVNGINIHFGIRKEYQYPRLFWLRLGIRWME